MTASTNPIWERIKSRVFIVAEIGKNFIQTEAEQPVEVYLERAKELVAAAHAAGADAVKFQTHEVEDEVLNIEFDSPHFKGKNRYAWVKRNTEATPIETFWRPLKAYCDELGVVFFSTPMSRGAARKLQQLGQPVWKVASSDILDFVLLDYLASTGKPIFLPTGMSTLEDVDRSVAFLREKKAMFVLMHAISTYPYPPEQSNLRTIYALRSRYPDVPVGFSQNSPWVEPAIAAAAMGISLLEQHFTLDRNLFGPDHKVSMVPEEMSRMIIGIRELESHPEKRDEILAAAGPYLGTEEKILQESEQAFRPLFRKSLMAGADIPAGTVITADLLYAMRPQQFAGGLPSEEYPNVLGKTAKIDLKKFDPVTWEVLA
ncbi:MAG: N-acetylneuraminate synthase [Candidatus Magasanikbacteria bacterium GW2011_GWA2_56_11]|uniref:N-acetylneuraminate synthase n=1 Tax=Candidatus Magasanikbacteria bacterium GW2011_GWA2_56_11 TaxID=1619044 RepID=A0A0G1YG11_9BACT|nr:MAG: N-acetylneuraminate synthase [Candidatus Magasanikbacteria bacterium GW2011_GWA2_56_11]